MYTRQVPVQSFNVHVSPDSITTIYMQYCEISLLYTCQAVDGTNAIVLSKPTLGRILQLGQVEDLLLDLPDLVQLLRLLLQLLVLLGQRLLLAPVDRLLQRGLLPGGLQLRLQPLPPGQLLLQLPLLLLQLVLSLLQLVRQFCRKKPIIKWSIGQVWQCAYRN